MFNYNDKLAKSIADAKMDIVLRKKRLVHNVQVVMNKN